MGTEADAVGPATGGPSVDDSLPLGTQLRRFVVTGGFSALVDFGLYQAFLTLGIPLNVAKAMSFVAGTATAYSINRRWTFTSSGGTRTAGAVLGLYAVTFAVQVGMNALLVHVLPEAWWRITVAFVIAQGTATAINFVVQRLVIFRR